MKAREKMIGRLSHQCPDCGGKTDKLSVNRRTDIICNKCGAVVRRLIELQPTYTQVVGCR